MAQVLSVYVLISLGIFFGIAIGSDVRRWLRNRRQDAPQGVSQSLGWRHE